MKSDFLSLSRRSAMQMGFSGLGGLTLLWTFLTRAGVKERLLFFNFLSTSKVGVGIIAPPPGTPFSAFSATGLSLQLRRNANRDSYALGANFTLSGADAAINPATQMVTLQVGTSTITIPPGSFRRIGSAYLYVGFIKGVSLTATISPSGRSKYTFSATAQNVNLTGAQNPVYITLTIGGDSGATSATADISG